MSSSSSSDYVMDPSLSPEYDITNADISGIYTADDRYDPAGGAVIHAKLEKGFPADKRRSHTIDARKYDRAFFTSDIHSDLRKFVQMLTNNKLIDTSIFPHSYKNPNSIYDPALIADSKWIGGSRTILVIIGDLVDGQRVIKKDGKTKRLNSVEDSKGSFEFLLFALLYNLRRKANREGSEILFTLGNHEYESFIQPGPSEYYKDFVPPMAKKFFSTTSLYDENIRKQALLPFLMTSPYYILSFATPKIEIVCIHGGFHHGESGENLMGDIITVQTSIDSGSNILESSVIDEALNTRIYNKEEGFCEHLEKPLGGELSNYLLTIVGHCPTNSFPRSKKIINEDDMYEGCDGHKDVEEEEYTIGCVVVDCRHEDGAPKLAFVDTAMSHAFRPSDQNENNIRSTQMLLLTHDPALEDDKRYFNKIERVAGVGQSGLDDAPSTILYAAPAKSGASASGAEASSSAVVETATATSTTGGRRPKRGRRTAKKRNLKKRKSRKLTASRRTRRAVICRL